MTAEARKPYTRPEVKSLGRVDIIKLESAAAVSQQTLRFTLRTPSLLRPAPEPRRGFSFSSAPSATELANTTP